MEKRDSEYEQRLSKVASLREGGTNPYPNDFSVQDKCGEIKGRFDSVGSEELEIANETVTIAGRIMAIRNFGKASFVVIQDVSGRLQIYVKKNVVGDDAYLIFKSCDVGDIVGVSGRLFRTRTGELTVEAAAFRLLSKSLRPLPEKWHGLKDVETRYRQRYLDMIMNPEVKETLLKRVAIIRIYTGFPQRAGFPGGGDADDAAYTGRRGGQALYYPPQRPRC